MNIFLRNIIAIFLLPFVFSSCQSRLLAQSRQDNVIVVPENLDKDVEAAVLDMAYWLERAGGNKFSIQKSKTISTKGIQLIPLQRSNLSNRIIGELNENGQSFHLLADGLNNVRITGTGKNSFINGIYTFLQELGFRWYMPGDLWTIVPSLNQNIHINKVYTPDFINRFYFGSGGISPIPGVDPTDEFSKDYLLWNRRNRISSDYANKGHSGLAFYTAMKKELDQHPEYFCGGKVNKNGWIDISKKGAVDLFVKWALSQVKPGERFPVIGVDPADGSGSTGDCLPTNMSDVKTWSDKYFWLANKVAERLGKGDTRTHVELYAYNQHAAVPGFALEKNVYPVIIPYAFQDVAEPDEYIKSWSKKMNGKPMGIYDYWNITQWGKCLPDFNIYSVPQKLSLWKRSNIKTINLESTYSKGAMGHVFWIATQLMWDADRPMETLYKEFLQDCFGEAVGPVRQMYDRWSLNYQGAMEVSFSLKDLAEASSKTKDKKVQERLEELKAYIQYLSYYEKYAADPSVANYESLINYMLSIHHLHMVHTSALLSYYIPKPKGYVVEKDRKVLEAKYGRIRKLTGRDIEENFKIALKTATPVYKISRLSFDIERAHLVKDNKKIYNPLYINNTNVYRFFLASAQQLVFQAGAGKDTRLLVKDKQGKVFLDKMIKASKQDYETVRISLPRGEYTLSFGALYRFSRIIFPSSIAVFSADHSYDNAGFPRHYIYVPKDVDEIVYNDLLGYGINQRGFWWDPSGKKVIPQKISKTVYHVPVPEQYRGKVWVLDIGHRSFNMLNIPSVYSLNMFSYDE